MLSCNSNNSFKQLFVYILLNSCTHCHVILIVQFNCNILTSDSAELSHKKCTCVNNRCIRSKISGDNLYCGWVELSADATLTEAGGYQTII